MGYVRCPQLSPNQSSKWRKIPFSIEAIPCFHVLPLQTLLGLLFLFLLVPGFFHRLLIKGRRNRVSLIWVRRFPSIRPQLAHTASTGRVTRFAGVTSLPWPQNRKQGHTRAFPFSAQSLSRPFPYGERRGCSRIWAVPVLLDSPTTAPHGSNRAGNPFRWCRSPTRFSKPHTGPHRGKSCFTDFSSRVFVLAEPQNPASGCNLPPLGWVILAKIFSLFSPPQIFALLTNC